MTNGKRRAEKTEWADQIKGCKAHDGWKKKNAEGGEERKKEEVRGDHLESIENGWPARRGSNHIHQQLRLLKPLPLQLCLPSFPRSPLQPTSPGLSHRALKIWEVLLKMMTVISIVFERRESKSYTSARLPSHTPSLCSQRVHGS